ncbi:hypothetical protein [Nonomuraea rubra]|uniref:hypothetical protein n=1 Tax=Nonomuraea rubra TaxID=46180 RepID=UPI0031E78C65
MSGIDPARMDGFAAAMERAGADVAEQTQAIRAELTRLGVGTLTLTPFVEIERWVRGQVPKLRARNAAIRRRVPGWTPGIVTYDEAAMPYATPEESRREGAAMAVLYRQHLQAAQHGMSSPLPNDAVRRFSELLARVLAHRDDPDFAAAFFGRLGTTATIALPKDLLDLFGPAATGLPAGLRAKQLLGHFSRLFAAATTASPPDSRFPRVMSDLERGGEGIDSESLSWLVSEGTFPTQWLTAVARRHLTDSGRVDVTGRFLSALSHDPTAARAVVTDLDGLSAWVAGDPEASDAFGRVLAAASGVYDEEDGGHGEGAAEFAFQVITRGPGLVGNDAVRKYFAEIAGAYATEFAASAAFLDPDSQLPSRFGGFDDKLVGTTPRFRLSLTDSYRFMKTFTDTNAHMEPFNKGMAALTPATLRGGRASGSAPAGLPSSARAAAADFGRAGVRAAGHGRGHPVRRDEGRPRCRGPQGQGGGRTLRPSAGQRHGRGDAVPPRRRGVASGGRMDVSQLGAQGRRRSRDGARFPDAGRQQTGVRAGARSPLRDRCRAHRAGLHLGGSPVEFQPPSDPLIADEAGRLRPYSEINENPQAMKAFLTWLREKRQCR